MKKVCPTCQSVYDDESLSHRITALLTENGPMMRPHIARALGKTRQQIRDALENLMYKDLVHQNNNRTWEVGPKSIIDKMVKVALDLRDAGGDKSVIQAALEAMGATQDQIESVMHVMAPKPGP